MSWRPGDQDLAPLGVAFVHPALKYAGRLFERMTGGVRLWTVWSPGVSAGLLADCQPEAYAQRQTACNVCLRSQGRNLRFALCCGVIRIASTVADLAAVGLRGKGTRSV